MTLSTSTVTLAPGSSRTYTLAPGEAVTVATEPNCFVTVTETPEVITTADQGGQTNVRTSILEYKGSWTYGPYALGGTVAVAVSLAKSTSSVAVTLGSSAAAVVGAMKYTWANKPAASALIGVPVLIDGIPTGGYSQWVSDGTYWRYLGQVSLLSNGNPGTSTSSTTETVLASVTVPALAMANSGKLIAEFMASYTNSANTKSLRLRVGGTGINGTVLWNQDVTTTAKMNVRCGFQNRNATGSQVQTAIEFGTGFGATTPSILTAAVDTTADFSVYLTGQCASGAEAIALQRVDMSLA